MPIGDKSNLGPIGGGPTWGVIRYAPGSGLLPEDDAAAFNGWYTHREDALLFAKHWAESYPQWIVALVKSDETWWGQGSFVSLRSTPLTERERWLTGTSGTDPGGGVSETLSPEKPMPDRPAADSPAPPEDWWHLDQA